MRNFDEFIFSYLSRQNPILPPRRNAETAEKHLAALRGCREAYSRLTEEELLDWAARVTLDGGSAIELPIEYDWPGTCRRFARDCGGVGGQALLSFARWIIHRKVMGHFGPAPEVLAAWRHLYPRTASLEDGATEEWELFLPTERQEQLLRDLGIDPDWVVPKDNQDTGAFCLAIRDGRLPVINVTGPYYTLESILDDTELWDCNHAPLDIPAEQSMWSDPADFYRALKEALPLREQGCTIEIYFADAGCFVEEYITLAPIAQEAPCTT